MELQTLKFRSDAEQALIRVSDASPDRASITDLHEHYSTWKTTVAIGAGLATAVLLTNIAILAWVKNTAENVDGVATVYDGSCEVAERAVLGADLVINVLSTLLLGASNNNAQLLSAPTRLDLDRSHARGIWLDVGVASFRNLQHIPRFRSAIWAFLLISTIPLHLFYNSVIFTTRSTVNYQAALVTEDFLTGGSWGAFDDKGGQVMGLFSAPQLSVTLKNASDLTRLDPTACLQAYGTSMYETQWRNVLVVTSIKSTNSTVLNVFTHSLSSGYHDISWVCNGDINTGENYYPPACGTDFLHPKNGAWTIPHVPTCPDRDGSEIAFNSLDGSETCEDANQVRLKFDAPVEYCLAEPFQQHCTVNISTALLIVVIVCNVLKISCMLATLSARGFRPLATSGDAIASFLTRPDPHTAGKGALEVGAVSSGVWREADNYGPQPWMKLKRRWWYAIPRIQLNLTFFWFFVGWIAAVIALSKSATGSNPFSSFGVIDATNIVFSSLDRGLVANVVLVNTPQLIISFIYVFYNNALTRMLMSYEYSQFATSRTTLRVTRPRGQQRSTHRLQLPYRYSFSMMMSMVLLHWLVSRGLFLVRIIVYDVTGSQAPDQDIFGCGFSPLAILLALCVITVMIVALVALGRYRYIDAAMPAASSCSAAISAAAHPAREETEAAAFLPLQYGVVHDGALHDLTNANDFVSGDRRFTSSGRGRQHVCFSSKEVTPLRDGIVYW